MKVRFAVICSVVVPALLMGQGDRRAMAQSRPIPRQENPRLKAGDFKQLNPARVAAAKRAELALEGPRARTIDSLVVAFDADAERWAKGLDTLQHAMRESRDLQEYEMRGGSFGTRERPKSPKDSVERARKDSIALAKLDKEMERILVARREFNAQLLTIHTAFDGYVTATNAALSDDQRAKLGTVLTEASDELTRRLHWVNQR